MLKKSWFKHTFFSFKGEEKQEIRKNLPIRSYFIVACGIPKMEYPLKGMLEGGLDESYREETDIRGLKLFPQVPKQEILRIAGDRERIQKQAYVLELDCTLEQVDAMMKKGEFYLSKHVLSYFDVIDYKIKSREMGQKIEDEDIIREIRQENKHLQKSEIRQETPLVISL